MKQKERLDEKVKQERTEPDHHRKIIIKGITVYESFRPEGSELWDCLLQSIENIPFLRPHKTLPLFTLLVVITRRE